ncbi:MAG TPA: hypothetical protein VEI95_08285 [Acidobacteriota bacterium]|nr:hypothetical protein [Acidobacteriota bacterium]
MVRPAKSGEFSLAKNGPYRPALICVIAPFLVKLAKHLALFACLAILGQASGRVPVSQLTLFFLVAGAALAHAIGNTLQLRLRKTTYSRRNPL